MADTLPYCNQGVSGCYPCHSYLYLLFYLQIFLRMYLLKIWSGGSSIYLTMQLLVLGNVWIKIGAGTGVPNGNIFAFESSVYEHVKTLVRNCSTGIIFLGPSLPKGHYSKNIWTLILGMCPKKSGKGHLLHAPGCNVGMNLNTLFAYSSQQLLFFCPWVPGKTIPVCPTFPYC